MPYDSKKRPNFLGNDYERTSLDRLSLKGFLSVADQNDNKIENTTQVPTAAQSIGGIAKIVGLVIAALAGAVIAVGAGGVALPAWLTSLATAIVAIAAPLGLASPGLPSLQKK